MACCVPRCSRKSTIKTKKVSYHSFPSDNSIRKKWIDAVSVANWNFKVQQTSKICSNHFSESCFQSTYENQRRLLKPGSVPSIFDWDKTVFLQRAESVLISNIDFSSSLSPVAIDNLSQTCVATFNEESIKAQGIDELSMDTCVGNLNGDATNEETSSVVDNLPKTFMTTLTEEISNGQGFEESPSDQHVANINNDSKNDFISIISQSEILANTANTKVITNKCNCSVLIDEVIDLNKKCSHYAKKLSKTENEIERLRVSLKFQKMVALSKSKLLNQEKKKSRALEKKLQHVLGFSFNIEEEL